MFVRFKFRLAGDGPPASYSLYLQPQRLHVYRSFGAREKEKKANTRKKPLICVNLINHHYQILIAVCIPAYGAQTTKAASHSASQLFSNRSSDPGLSFTTYIHSFASYLLPFPPPQSIKSLKLISPILIIEFYSCSFLIPSLQPKVFVLGWPVRAFSTLKLPRSRLLPSLFGARLPGKSKKKILLLSNLRAGFSPLLHTFFFPSSSFALVSCSTKDPVTNDILTYSLSPSPAQSLFSHPSATTDIHLSSTSTSTSTFHLRPTLFARLSLSISPTRRSDQCFPHVQTWFRDRPCPAWFAGDACDCDRCQ